MLLFLLDKFEKSCYLVLLLMCCPSIELGEKEDGEQNAEIKGFAQIVAAGTSDLY
ncbi:MAG: hypothetical protein ACRENG_18010 [bacterium]